jgi:hypothetical protein
LTCESLRYTEIFVGIDHWELIADFRVLNIRRINGEYERAASIVIYHKSEAMKFIAFDVAIDALQEKRRSGT